MRTAIVGLGWVGREVWLPRLTAHPKFTLVAMAEHDPAAVERAGLLPEGLALYDDYRAVDLESIDAVFVLTPNNTHGRIGEWFLRAGKAVFLEKPTVTDRGQLDQLSRAADSGGRLVLSSAGRYRAELDVLRTLVVDGVLGTPRLAELSWVRSRGIPTSGWFTNRSMSGGGVLVDLGWHLIDIAHSLWGAAPIRSATAVATADFLHREGWDARWRGAGVDGAATARAVGPESGQHGDVEDQLTALVATATYAMQLRLAWASHEEVDRTTIALHGTDGSAVLSTTFGFSPLRDPVPTLVLKRGGAVESIALPKTAIGEEYDRQLDALVGMLEDPAVTAAALRDASQVRAIVDACYRAVDKR